MTVSATTGVFIWENYQSWRPIILRLLGDLIDEKVFNELANNPPRYFVSDKLDWLNEAITRAKGTVEPDICTTLLQRLPRHFGFLRAYHGCRTESSQTYLMQGVLPSDPSALNGIARDIFSNKERVEDAIRDLAKEEYGSSYREHNADKVFFCLQMGHLIEDCGHYLLYGSEYLQAIANTIGEADTLRRRGKATIIECHVPMKDIPPEYLYCLAGEILREIFEEYCNEGYEPEILHFGFPIVTKLEAKNIVCVHHPTGIPNPHRFRIRED